MKVFTDKVKIATTRADQAVACRCYNASMEIQKPKKGEFQNCSRPPSLSKVMVVDLDARGWQEMKMPDPTGELEDTPIGLKLDQMTRIVSSPISLR